MASPKMKGLGRGLESLFGDLEIRAAEDATQSQTIDGETVRYIDINEIRPNATQPRKVFNEEKIDELAASITANGVIQPILLRQLETGYELAAGERRWRAARKAGLKRIPAIIKELTPEQLMMVALIENIQREDLNPMEEAEALHRICHEFNLTQDEVSKSVGKSRPYITNALRLLKLPEEIKAMVLEGKLSNGHARALISLESTKRQIQIAEKVVADNLTVRETEKLVKDLDRKGKLSQKTTRTKSSDVLGIETELKELLGTRVTIIQKGKKGKLEIDYFSREELERLIEIFRRIV